MAGPASPICTRVQPDGRRTSVNAKRRQCRPFPTLDMEPTAPTLEALIKLPLAVLAFALPGFLFSRLFPCGLTALTTFVGSCLILFQVILVLTLGNLPLHTGSVGLPLAVVSLLLVAWRRRNSHHGRTRLQPAPAASTTWWMGWGLGAVGLGVIAIKAVVDPLSGFDNGFRWDYLARLMVARQSLAGYPPVSANDFEYYAWCDSIPPLVASLNFWIYSATGSIAPTLVGIRLIAEGIVIGLTAERLSRLYWGDRVGGAPVAVLASSALVLWTVSLGQETGLTTISLLGMLTFLEVYARTNDRGSLVWAAACAALGGLAREYGLAFALLGLAVLAVRRTPVRRLGLFTGVVALMVAPWYIRTWVLTGNPLFPMTLGGLFPGNPQHDAVMAEIARAWSFRLHGERFASFIALLIGATALAPVILGLAGAIRLGTRAWPVLAAIVMVVVLWLWSIPYTGAGWMYSARVLLPALGLLAALSGWIGASRCRIRWILAGALALITVDATRRAWFLPWQAALSPTALTLERWTENQTSLRQIGSHPVWPALVVSAQGGGIVVDHPANHALITLRGGRAVSIFSPALRPTFDPGQSFDAALAALQADGIRLIALPWVRSENAAPLLGHPFWDRLHVGYRPNVVIEQLTIFDLADLRPTSAP